MKLIELRNVGVEFPVYGVNANSFRRTLFRRATGGSPHAEKNRITVTALDDITFDVVDGDRVGLLGHNGAGKSTLLRVLAGVYEPTRGSIKVNGKVSSLFNPALGMDPDDTALENIRTIGLFLGMTPKDIENKIDEIAEFTELGEFLALPVRTYSSGMQVRLAFAISTAIDPEILLLDEGFGMGDSRFADRAQKRVDSLLHRTRVLVVATHAEDLIRSMCNKAMLLEQGRIVAFGPADEVIDAYHQHTAALQASG